jgi:arabinofuranosyltransferase
VSSRAFVDYSTSGLENPLTHLLLAVFATAWFRRENPFFRAALFVTVGLITLNRHDTLLLVLPAMIAAGWPLGRRRFALLALLGAAPVIIWEAFSLLYYGLLVPNTAFAKLNTGADSIELVRQGLTYVRDSFDRDPLVLPTTLICAALTIVRWRAGALPIGLGVLLYLSYVVIIGGDFMTGPVSVGSVLPCDTRADGLQIDAAPDSAGSCRGSFAGRRPRLRRARVRFRAGVRC